MSETGALARSGPYKAGDITIDPVLDTPAPRRDVTPWWANHYTFFGTAVGLLFVFLSLTPSLLPRGPLFQGLVSGGAGAIGYLIGVFAVWLVRYMRSKDTSPTAPRWAWLTLLVVGIVGMVVMQFLFHRWQDDVRDLMGVPNACAGTTTRRPRSSASSCCSCSSRSGSGSEGWCCSWYTNWNALRRQGFRVWWPSAWCWRCRSPCSTAWWSKHAMDWLNAHVRRGQRRGLTRQLTTYDPAAFRWPGITGVVGVAGTSGPDLHLRRTDGRRADEIQRRTCHRADPGVRRSGFGRRYLCDRRDGGP